MSTTLRRKFGSPIRQVSILSVAQDQLVAQLAVARAIPRTRELVSLMPFPFYELYKDPAALGEKLWQFLDVEDSKEGHPGLEKQKLINNFLAMRKRVSGKKGKKGNLSVTSTQKIRPELMWRHEVGKGLEEKIDYASYMSDLLLGMNRTANMSSSRWY